MNPYDFTGVQLEKNRRAVSLDRLLDAARPAAFGIAALISIGSIGLNVALERSDAIAAEAKGAAIAPTGAAVSIEAKLGEWSVAKLGSYIDNAENGAIDLKMTDDGCRLVKLPYGPMSGALIWLDSHGVINDYRGSPAVQMPNGDRIHFKDGEPSTVGATNILGYRKISIDSAVSPEIKEIYQQLIASEVGGEPVVLRRSYSDQDLVSQARDEYRLARIADGQDHTISDTTSVRLKHRL